MTAPTPQPKNVENLIKLNSAEIIQGLKAGTGKFPKFKQALRLLLLAGMNADDKTLSELLKKYQDNDWTGTEKAAFKLGAAVYANYMTAYINKITE